VSWHIIANKLIADKPIADNPGERDDDEENEARVVEMPKQNGILLSADTTFPKRYWDRQKIVDLFLFAHKAQVVACYLWH
jgi:hypothetical protein